MIPDFTVRCRARAGARINLFSDNRLLGLRQPQQRLNPVTIRFPSEALGCTLETTIESLGVPDPSYWRRADEASPGDCLFSFGSHTVFRARRGFAHPCFEPAREGTRSQPVPPIFRTLNGWIRFAYLIPVPRRTKAPSPAWSFKALDGGRRGRSEGIMSLTFGLKVPWQLHAQTK